MEARPGDATLEAERKLAAIFAADVEGYARLMGIDEEATLRALTARRATMDGLIVRHRGRVVNTAGDSVLAEFASVVDAVRCAVETQDAIATANVDQPVDRRMRFRIGINLGDVLVRDGNLFGDGVNVAARLETLAEPGGICVSGTVRDHVGTKLAVAFTDLGEQAIKNIAQPVRVFRVAAGATAPPAADISVALPPPDKPSLAVLPFQNLSGDPEQDYFAEGMAEDIITALSRWRWLFVIARNSSFTYKGRTANVKQIGCELGVRYMLEGSVRRSGQRVRISAQLIDAATGAHLWADRFDGALDDVFDLQDRVTASVVGAIAPSLERAEIARARRKPTENLDAYDHYLQALPHVEVASREAIDKALPLLYRAIELDPNYAAAYAMAARCYNLRWTNGWTADRAGEKAETVRLARRAVSLGRDDALSLAYAGCALGRVGGDLDLGLEVVDRALALDPHLAVAWHFSGVLNAYAGRPEKALERLAGAMQLSPRDAHLHIMMAATSLAHFVAGHYDEAAMWSERSIGESGDFIPAYRTAVAAYALAGRPEEARHALKRLLAVEPDCRLAKARELVPLRRPADLDHFVEGLRLAGLPE